MTSTGRRRAGFLAAVLLAGLGLTIGVHGLRWRAQVLGMKAVGKIPNLAWRDLLRMLPPRSGYYLEPILETGNPYASIENPYTAEADSAAGARMFRLSCTQCHATGSGAGPDLLHAPLRHPSDWALYETIRNGLPGTPMQAHEYTDRQRWQIIAYLRSSRRSAAASTRVAAFSAPVVAAADLVGSARHPGDWLTYSGSYDGHRFSPLTQINTSNVAGLRPIWLFQPQAADEKNEATPIVVGDVMYVTASPNSVWALDARTGAVRWRFTHSVPGTVSLCCSAVNRGVAVLGSLVYVGTVDAHLIALDANTGQVKWDVTVGDPQSGYSITGAPLATPEGIITGVGGGEYGVSGVIDAYDPLTGKRKWRFYTVPRPGEPGHDTWSGESWRTGGAPTWLTGAYDTATHVLYWGVGNPGPNYAGAARVGANLYSNSVVALDAATGHLRWYFQFTPHDEHDWDAAQVPMLADLTVKGRPRHVLLWANRNAFYYVLDRETGAFLAGRSFEYQTWANGLDSAGAPEALPGISPSDTGTFLYPSVVGATNWWSPSFDAQRGLVFVPTLHLGGTYYLDRTLRRGDLFTGGASTTAIGQPFWNAVKALDPVTGALRWEYRFPSASSNIAMGGVTATASGVVFAGDGPQFVALDARNGRELWSFAVGAPITAAAVTYLAGGQERVALMAGRSLVVFGLDHP